MVPDSVRTFQTKWSWFNSWDIEGYNISASNIQAVYKDPTIVTLDQVPDWRA